MEAIRTFINGIYWKNNCSCSSEESKDEKTIVQDILCGITHWFAFPLIVCLCLIIISSIIIYFFILRTTHCAFVFIF